MESAPGTATEMQALSNSSQVSLDMPTGRDANSSRSLVDTATLHKEIDLIQSVISRMANNSFLIKGWTLTILAFVLATKNDVPAIAACFPIILAFWYLDAYYLRQERMYRKLYDWVINSRRKNNQQHLYSLSPIRFQKDVQSLTGTMFSQTLLAFYLFPFLIASAFLLYQLSVTSNQPAVTIQPTPIIQPLPTIRPLSTYQPTQSVQP